MKTNEYLLKIDAWKMTSIMAAGGSPPVLSLRESPSGDALAGTDYASLSSLAMRLQCNGWTNYSKPLQVVWLAQKTRRSVKISRITPFN